MPLLPLSSSSSSRTHHSHHHHHHHHRHRSLCAPCPAPLCLSYTSGSGSDHRISLNFPNVRPRVRRSTFFDEEDDVEAGNAEVSTGAAAADTAVDTAATDVGSVAAGEGHQWETYDSGLSKEEVEMFQEELSALYMQRKGGHRLPPQQQQQQGHASDASSSAPVAPPTAVAEQRQQQQEEEEEQPDEKSETAADATEKAEEVAAEGEEGGREGEEEEGGVSVWDMDPEERRQRREERVARVRQLYDDGEISMDDAIGEILDELMSDPEIMEQALKGVDTSRVLEDEESFVAGEIEAGRLGISAGGVAGGISDRIVEYGKTNDKYYNIMKHEPVVDSSGVQRGYKGG